MMRSLALSLLLLLAPLSHGVVVSRPAANAGAPLAGPAFQWNLSPAQMLETHRLNQLRLESTLAGIASIKPEDANFANTVLPFERAQAAWAQQWVPLRFLSETSPDAAVREAARTIEAEVNQTNIALGQREDLYRLFEAAAAKDEALSPDDRRLLEGTLRGYRRSGMGLEPAKREKLKALQQRLAVIGQEFERNISEHQDSLEIPFERARALGLPEDYLASLPREGDSVKVGLDYPSYTPFMRYAIDASLRKALREKFESRGAPANLPLAQEALELRRDIATLLGQPSFPALALQDRMAKTPEAVNAFLQRVAQAVMPRARAELAELLEFKRRDDPSAQRIEGHDIGYYGRRLKEERHALDGNLVKEYFPVDRVVEGTLKVYQRVLGVTFRELTDGPRWHPDVRLFEITGEGGRRIGHFYLDLYPRENKFSHAAAFPLSLGMRAEDGGYVEPVAAMVANFPKAAPGKPALLPHGDVETFFHEFGHLMHQTLTTAKHASQSGSSVATDFVEGPSQMLEEFVWKPEVLAELSGHWRTGAPLPAELFEKMTAARSVLSATEYAFQAALAMADMALHLGAPADPSALYNDIIGELTGVDVPPGQHPLAAFGHLIGYENGYYGYLWSKVFALDMFSRFAEGGVLSPEVGAAYRRHILETGSSRPEMDSLRAFLGREPSEAAFARELEQGPAPSGRPPLSKEELTSLMWWNLSVLDQVKEAGGGRVRFSLDRDAGDPSQPVWTAELPHDAPVELQKAAREAMDALPGFVRVRLEPAPLS
jgi:thimet oligopeptidase